jgi:hypothetical protein
MGGSFPSCRAGADSSYRAGSDPAFEEWAARQGYSHLLPSPDSELPAKKQRASAQQPAAAAATLLPPSAASSGKASKAKITSSYEPPPPVQMRSRLCALNFDLIRDMKAKFHNRPIPAGEITKWFKSNPQQLDGTGISIDQISTDHIIPKSVGGYDHLFNYYIMPKGHNSHFKDNWTPEKQAYVGKQGVKIAQGFSQWCKDKATPDLQFFDFRADNYLL